MSERVDDHILRQNVQGKTIVKNLDTTDESVLYERFKIHSTILTHWVAKDEGIVQIATDLCARQLKPHGRLSRTFYGSKQLIVVEIKPLRAFVWKIG